MIGNALEVNLKSLICFSKIGAIVMGAPGVNVDDVKESHPAK